MDASELEKDHLYLAQETHSPVSSDWHTVSPRSDDTSTPESQSSPYIVADSVGETTASTTISISPLLASDQDKETNTTSINGEQQGSSTIKGGNGEPVTPSSGGCTLRSQADLHCPV